MDDLDALAAQHCVVLGGGDRLDGSTRGREGVGEGRSPAGGFDHGLRWDAARERAIAAERALLDEQGASAQPAAGTGGGETTCTASYD
jgi:hypothetical protein